MPGFRLEVVSKPMVSLLRHNQDDEPEDVENHLIPHFVICFLTPGT
jgi:hypothetical protein